MTAGEVRFCDMMMSLENYNEEVAFRAYVGKFYRHLMTPLERRTSEYSVPITSDIDNEKARRLYTFLEDRDGHVDDTDVIAVFEKLSAAERIAAPVDRLLADHLDDLHVNRCPVCSRITRTPRAKQCPWCRHSWHGS